MKTLVQIADDYAAVKQAAREYWKKVLSPKVDACTSKEEFDALCEQVSAEAAGDRKGVRDLPGDISVSLAIARQRWQTFD